MIKGKAFQTEKHGYRKADVEKFIVENDATRGELKNRVQELTKQLSEKEAELKVFKQKQDLIVKSIMGAVQKAEQIEQLIRQKYVGELAYLNAFHQMWTEYYRKLLEKYPLNDEVLQLNRFNKKLDAILCGEDEPKEKFKQARQQFENENERLRAQKKKYVGFIPVDGVRYDDGNDGDEIDLSCFNPEENIRQMLRRQIAEEEQSLLKENEKSKKKTPEILMQKSTKQKPPQQGQRGKNQKPPVAATLAHSDLKESDSGFSFEEALNPTQQLSDILKEIGIDLGNDD